MKSSADIHFNDAGVPVSNAFGDIYFSVDSGIDESHYVFIEQNDLPQRWSKLPANYEFVVTETGFGTGLNFLLCWQTFLQHAPSSARLVFSSFEKYPLSRQQLTHAYRSLPQLQPLVSQLLAVYPALESGCHRLLLNDGRVTLDLWFGDIDHWLPQFAVNAAAQVDAIFLDGFAPSKNPDMWQPKLFEQLAGCAHRNTSYATFTAAGVVKRGLQAAGFSVEKVKGFGRKRDMLRGRFERSTQDKASLDQRPVTIIGAGIAGASLALALHRRGVDAQIVSKGIADGASGNPQGAVYPLLHAEYTPLSRFYLQAFSTACSAYQPWADDAWFQHGVAQPAFNEQRLARQQKLTDNLYSESTLQAHAASDAEQQLQLVIDCPYVSYPQAGWIRPASMVTNLLQQANVDVTEIGEEPLSEHLHAAERTVVAAGHQSAAIVEQHQDCHLPINPVRGQVTFVNATAETQSLTQVLCYKGYMVPADGQLHCIGATFKRGDSNSDYRPQEDLENLASLQQCAQQPWAQSLTSAGGRASVRATTADHQPIAGALSDRLWVLSGLGSRGLTAAPLLAEIIAAQLTGGLVPLGPDALQRLQPQRFMHQRSR